MVNFFFNDPATTAIYTLSLHDALPICNRGAAATTDASGCRARFERLASMGYDDRRNGKEALGERAPIEDRKSTRLNSSHSQISYAVFCLKKKIKIYFLSFNSCFRL